jgi:hypothetical protein
MPTPTQDEIQEFYKEETEYKTQDDVLVEAYTQAVTEGNENDDSNDD